MPSTTSLRQLLIDQLHDIHDAEQQLLSALPEMAAAASGDNLKQAFLDHLEETKVHVARVEKALGLLDRKPEGKTCLAMKGLVAEGAEAIALQANGAVRDIALIGAARRVEHYELAAYKSVRALATGVDEESVADLLQQTMDEECEADKRLCSLGDLVIEAAKDFTGDDQNAVAKSAPRKLGKKKQK